MHVIKMDSRKSYNIRITEKNYNAITRKIDRCYALIEDLHRFVKESYVAKNKFDTGIIKSNNEPVLCDGGPQVLLSYDCRKLLSSLEEELKPFESDDFKIEDNWGEYERKLDRMSRVVDELIKYRKFADRKERDY